MNVNAAEIPLSQPLYGASFGQAVKRFFKKYATFSGRASRSEYWWVQLFLWLVAALFSVLMSVAGVNMEAFTSGDAAALSASLNGFSILLVTLSGIWGLVLIIPTMALTWRRLHDANLAGPWWFLSLTGVGGIVVFIMTLMPSNPAGVRFDRN